jgi:GT2 family glycosyltransferase
VPKISVVVVAYKSRETIGKCLSSLPLVAEVIVVENPAHEHNIDPSSLPGTVQLITMPSNEGFGRASNVGMAAATGHYVLILNPDAWADDPSDVLELAEFLDNNPGAIAVGGRLMLTDGTVQLSCARELTLARVFLEQSMLERLVHGYWIDTSHASAPIKVPQVTGACFAFRRVEGKFLPFDDRFFLYCEDTELMKRLAKHGDIYHLPTAVFHHLLGASSKSSRWFAVACYNRGKELYFEIHHGNLSSFLCFLSNRSGVLLRLLVWSLATVLTLGTFRRFRESAATFLKVLLASTDPYRGSDRPGEHSDTP